MRIDYFLYRHFIRRKSLRRARALLLSMSLWRRRLVFWCGALLIGAIAACFAIAADKAQIFFTNIVAWNVWMPLILSPAVFAAGVWITQRWFPSTAGSGIPQAIAAEECDDPKIRHWLLGPKTILAKMALTILALIGGASVGREGPTVQVGAAVLLICAGLSGIKSRRGVIVAGAAAGVAAAFNTPLAGVVFAIEELARGFHHRNTAVVLTSIVLAGAASMSLLGNYNYFGVADTQFAFSRIWFPIGVLGLLGGLAGGLFARLMIAGGRTLRELRGSIVARHPVLFAAICGLIVAVLGLMTHGDTYGTGYAVANDLLHGHKSVTWSFTAAKFLATLLSNISGLPGGIFSPSLSVGAAMGSAMSGWFPYAPAQGVILLSMVAYFAGVTQAPITAFVIVLEITGKGIIPAPLIATAVIATAAARVVCPHSLYHALAKNYQRLAEREILAATDAPEMISPTEIAKQ